jgi:nucleotide-binding universal stress UspA family protein
VLCPIDFSEPSRAALVYAAAIADHFTARLLVLAVDDPLLAEAAASAGLVPSLAGRPNRSCSVSAAPYSVSPFPDRSNSNCASVSESQPSDPAPSARDRGRSHRHELAWTYRCAQAVLRLDDRARAPGNLRARGSHASGPPGGTIPVRYRTPGEPGPRAGRPDGRITPASPAAVAQARSVPLLIAHVLEPVAIPLRVRLAVAGADASRRARAEERMQEILASVAAHVKTQTLVLSGDPADEIVTLTDVRHANLIVMGLHSSELLGPRMGSVTYRVLALTRTYRSRALRDRCGRRPSGHRREDGHDR